MKGKSYCPSRDRENHYPRPFILPRPTLEQSSRALMTLEITVPKTSSPRIQAVHKN